MTTTETERTTLLDRIGAAWARAPQLSLGEVLRIIDGFRTPAVPLSDEAIVTGFEAAVSGIVDRRHAEKKRTRREDRDLPSAMGEGPRDNAGAPR